MDAPEAVSPAPALADVARGLPVRFWLYALGCAASLAGVATFSVLGYHMVSSGIVGEGAVPVLYAVAMAVDALFALLTGSLYDRIGARTLRALPVVCALIPLFAYADSLAPVAAGVVLWGASTGIQESTMRAAIGDMVDPGHRASAYGIFSVFIGAGGLLGGVAAGALYAVGPAAICAYTLAVEAVAFAVIWHCTRG